MSIQLPRYDRAKLTPGIVHIGLGNFHRAHMAVYLDDLFAKYEHRPLGEKKRIVGEAVPFGRMGTAADLTGMAIFLATPEADYICAQAFGVDGGNWMA